MTSGQAYQSAELYHRPRHCYLVCNARNRRRTWNFKSGGTNAKA